MRIAQEEIFGPTTALIRVRDFDEAIRVSNDIKFGLSSSIFTRDVNKAFRAMRDLQAGITYINAGTIGAEVHLPFGGTKDTGNGHREAGQAALDQAVGDRLADQRMVGDLALARQIFRAGDLVGKDRRDQILGAHARELRRAPSCRRGSAAARATRRRPSASAW